MPLDKHVVAQRRIGVVRLLLGGAQMVAATFALVSLAVEGVTARALAGAVIACSLTMVSVLLFRCRRSTN